MTDLRIRRAVFALFLLSGACGLIYQVVWTRMMTLLFGVTVYAVSTVLCSFMAGLAMGSLVFGRVADRSRRPLMLYGYLEIGIGLCGAIFPYAMEAVRPLFVLIHRTWYEAGHGVFSLARFGIVFPMLLVPTFLMGGTFPIVSRYFVRARGTLTRDVGFLYAVNTSGAVIGVFLVGFVLLAYLGMWNTTMIAALGNILVGIVSVLVGRHAVVSLEGDALDAGQASSPVSPGAPESHDRTDTPSALEAPGDDARPAWVAQLALIAIALSGFVSLGLEVLWTRVLVFHTHNSTYAFSSMLMAFLIGIAGGGWLMGLIAPRVKRPFLLFALLQVGIAVWSVGSLYGVGQLQHLTNFLADAIPFDNWAEIVVIILSQSLATLLFPATLMGMTFPLATTLATRGMGRVGRGIGDVYAANTFGTVAGSFLTGFVLIPLLTVRGSFIFLAGINCAIAALLILAGGELAPRLRKSFVAGCVLFILAAQLVMPADVVSNDFSKTLGNLVYYNEEVTDTIMVIDLKDRNGIPQKDYRMLVFADGRGTAGHATKAEDRFYAHLPMLLHPDPKEVLLICVGAGNTLGAFLDHSRMERIDCVELSPGVLEASRRFETNDGALEPPLDPRIRMNIDDGRNYLLGSDRTYDIVHLDPPELHTAGIVYLYTREFYEAAKARLKPGGVFSHWFNASKLTAEEMRDVVATFHDVFPHGTIWQGPGIYSWNLIATDRPLTVPLRAASTIMSGEERVRANLVDALNDPGREMVDPHFFFSHLLMDEHTLAEYSKGARILTDDLTIVDYSSPRSPYSGFGFVHIFMPSDSRRILREEARKRQDEPARKPEPGGWVYLTELAMKTDDVASIIDWTGYSDEERAAAEAAIHQKVAERKALMEKWYKDLTADWKTMEMDPVDAAPPAAAESAEVSPATDSTITTDTTKPADPAP